MQEFLDAYEGLLKAYRASSDNPDQAYARMVGALNVIISFHVDPQNLAVLTKNLQDSAKRQTLEILKKETV